MDSFECRWFAPQRGFRQTLPFIIVFGLFIIGGVLIILFGPAGPGIAVTCMGLFFYALIIPQAAAVGRKYGICVRQLQLKTLMSRKVITFGEIDSVALMSKAEGRRFMEELYRSSVDAERQMDLGRWLRSNRKSAEVIRYLSVPVTGTETRRGRATNITSYSVDPDAEMILLRLNAGGRLLISPADVTAFYSALVGKGAEARPVSSGEALSLQAGSGPSRDFRKTIRGISIVIFLVILALVGYFVIYPEYKAGEYSRPGSAGETADEGPADTSDIPVAIWLDEDSFAFGVPKDDLPDMEREGGVSAMLFSKYAAPALVLLLESEGEIEVGSTANTELIEYLADFMLLHCRMSYSGEAESDSGIVYNVFTVERTEIRNFIASLVRNLKF